MLSALRVCFVTVVMFHFAVIFGNLAACFVLPLEQPWYVALPLVALVVNLTFSPIICPLTKLENVLRRQLGMKEIRGFVKHYIINTIVRPNEKDKAKIQVQSSSR